MPLITVISDVCTFENEFFKSRLNSKKFYRTTETVIELRRKQLSTLRVRPIRGG